MPIDPSHFKLPPITKADVAMDHYTDYENPKKPVGKLQEALIGAPKTTNPLEIQVAGSHYKSKGIQPIEYIHANGLNFSEGSIVKYITRWRDKGGVEDLKKIKHYVDLLIEMERKYGNLSTGS